MAGWQDKIIVGTSGYSYPDWVGPFYPPGTRRSGMLPIYAGCFPTVELNFTYYGIPRPKSLERMVQATPAGFSFFVKAYRQPRELIWITGCIMFFLVLAFGFSGYLLPWNELAFFATKVGTNIASVVPGIGDWLEQFLRGGDRVSGATLSRFYGWHVAILPALATLVLVVHLLLVQIQGMSTPPGSLEEAERRRPMRFFPDFALRDLFGWIVALAVLVAMAALFPWELGEKANPFAPAPANIRPEWYFIFLFETLKLVPGGSVAGLEYEAIPILLSLVGAVGLVLVPFFDNDPLRKGRSRLFSGLGIAALLYAVGMTAWGYHSPVPIFVVVGLIGLLAVLAWAAGDRRAS